MKQYKISKKILSTILSCVMVFQTIPVHCRANQKNSISKSGLWTGVGISGTIIACLTVGFIYEFKSAQEKQDKIERLERIIKDMQLSQSAPPKTPIALKPYMKTPETSKPRIMQNGEKSATENLQEAWYITYYCVTKGIVDNYDDWTEIAKKCVVLSNSNMKIRKSLNGLLEQSNRKNISECDFIFNMLVATYLSSLPIGALKDGIPIEFCPLLWLDRCNFQVPGNSLTIDRTFETCKKLAIDLLTETAVCFKSGNPKEVELSDMLQTDFIDVLTTAQCV